MKNFLKFTTAFSLAIVVSNCNSKKEDNEIVNDSIKSVSIIDTLKTQPKAEISKSIDGKVEEITNGKDGYTAKVITSDDEIYYVTISHSNLIDHQQYKTFKIGEEIKVTGVFWQIENSNQITVRSIN